MIEEVIKLGLSPDIDVLFIDEAQDLSTIQIQAARMWADKCEKVVFVGDEDQAIYRFLGAVPEDFRNLELEDNPIILKHSYRVPRKVHKYAMRLISQIKNRDPVEYLPIDTDGDCYPAFIPDLGIPGEHMIIARCQYHLKRWVTFLTREGRPWHNPYREGVKAWNPTRTALWKAVKAYDHLKSGLDIRGADLVEMISKLPAEIMERGVKTHCKKIVDQDIGPHTTADIFKISSLPYFKADFFNFSTPISHLFPLSGQAGALINLHGIEITRKEPTVILGTIHSIKGGECENVWVDTSTSPTIMREILSNETAWEDEIRLAYVAATRSKNILGCLVPFGPPSGVWPL
jgi:DNA helicase II / ATP-dependent DNA helicase PcrA